MEITTKNFLTELPAIREAIREASFFAIDCEFTGLSLDRTVLPFDTPEEMYEKTAKNFNEFIIVQFGLCAFRVNPPVDGKPVVTYKCYNFYCCPNGRFSTFCCQGESMRFLADHQFDFNKLFRDGLSYATETEEEKLRHDLKERQSQRASVIEVKADADSDVDGEDGGANLIAIPPEDQQLVNDNDVRIEAFLRSNKPELVIARCKPFQRRLIYQLIETKYRKTVLATTVTVENNQKAIRVEKKPTPEQEMERQTQENEELECTIGLSLVLKELSKAKKLIVGHNMMLDLLHIIKQFFRPLPLVYQDFKKLARRIFPMILDTKYLCTNAEIKAHISSSMLGHVYEAILKEPFQLPENISSALPEQRYDGCTDLKEHDAAYDAYQTGLCYLGLISFFKVDLETMTKDETLKQYFNRIFMVRLVEVNYIFLHGQEPTVSRDHIFYVTFPESWRISDILQRFKNFGQVHINWINSTSAFVTLHKRDAASRVIKHIGFHAGFTISTFGQLKANHALEVSEDGTTILILKQETATEQTVPSLQRVQHAQRKKKN